MARPWFDIMDCTILEIKKYQSISVHHVVRAVTIDDVDAIRKIMHRIESLPASGDMMISWGADAESIEMCFRRDNHPDQKIEIYQGRFKTPSTGFNSRNELESSIFFDVEALLFPAIAKRMLKIKNIELQFDGFSLTYLGVEHSLSAPVSVTWSSDQFLVKSASGVEQLIKIASGQRPPAPYSFDVGGSRFTLLTYQTEAQERLFPEYFQVIGDG